MQFAVGHVGEMSKVELSALMSRAALNTAAFMDSSISVTAVVVVVSLNLIGMDDTVTFCSWDLNWITC